MTMEHRMSGGPDDREAATTALSTISARLAVLERWMRDAQRRQTTLIIIISILVVLCAALLVMRLI